MFYLFTLLLFNLLASGCQVTYDQKQENIPDLKRDAAFVLWIKSFQLNILIYNHNCHCESEPCTICINKDEPITNKSAC